MAGEEMEPLENASEQAQAAQPVQPAPIAEQIGEKLPQEVNEQEELRKAQQMVEAIKQWAITNPQFNSWYLESASLAKKVMILLGNNEEPAHMIHSEESQHVANMGIRKVNLRMATNNPQGYAIEIR